MCTILQKCFFIPASILECNRGKLCAKHHGENLGIWAIYQLFVEIEGFEPKQILVGAVSIYLTIFIRRVTLNAERDTVYLFVRHGQRIHFGVYPLVCPFSTWPGQGFYVELFLIGALNRLQRWQRNRAFLAQTSTYKGNVLCFFAEK